MTLSLSAKSPTISAMLPPLVIAILFAAGCRTPPGQTLLERENFQQEKKIEDLQDEVEEAEQDLAQCRRENAALKKQSGGSAALPSGESPRMTPPPDLTPPTSPPPNIPLFQPPKIDRGTESPPEDSPAPPGKTSAEQWTPPKDSPPAEPLDPSRSDDSPPAFGAMKSSYQEEESQGPLHLAMIRLLTNGHQFGGHTADSYISAAIGDNGVQVAFSPRDAKNRPVAAEGSIAIVVVDPAMSGPEARVARWDFSPDEARAHFRQTLFGKAYRFDLLWPHEPPQHDRLKLFVRLTSPDGDRLAAEQTIHVRLGTPAPAVDDSEVADSPTPPNEPIHSAPPPRTTAATETDRYEPDEPAPHGPESSAPAMKTVAHNGAVWKPYR